MPIDYSKWDNVGASSDSDEGSASSEEGDGLTSFGESGGGISNTAFDREDASGPSSVVPPGASKAERELIRRGVDYEREGNWIRAGVRKNIIVVRRSEAIWIWISTQISTSCTTYSISAKAPGRRLRELLPGDIHRGPRDFRPGPREVRRRQGDKVRALRTALSGSERHDGIHSQDGGSQLQDVHVLRFHVEQGSAEERQAGGVAVSGHG